MKNPTEVFIGYDTYLFSCLLKVYNTDFREMDIDEQFELLPELYGRFDKSEYNNPNKGLYECINEYLSNGNYKI